MSPTARRLTVLLVDDDPGDVLMIEEALESVRTPRDVYVVNDGEQALSFLRQTGSFATAPRPDVILLDLNMPRMDGREVLAVVKTDPVLNTIPIVVFTTSKAPDDILKSYALHANAYVTKPLNLDELTEVVVKIDDFFTHIAALPPQLPAAG
jgi:CheY-like chemotaxis protein